MNTTTHTLYVTGTHCNACKILIEETLRDVGHITSVDVSLRDKTVTIKTDSSTTQEALATELSALLTKHGYTLTTHKPTTREDTGNEWLYASVAVIVALVGFIALERAGLTSLITTGEATIATAFVVGLVASVSTCLAVVGGLVLSVSATYAHEGAGWRPQALFHGGRIIGFLILGGLLGLLGDVLQIGFYGSAILATLASIVMLILGIHLLDITTRVRAFTLPRGLSQWLAQQATRAGMFAPMLLGAATFFLPCGFTQSMQVIALSSGSVVAGALTMLAFSLGTLPVLALLSFGSMDLAKSRFRGTFFKAAGMLVIVFALYNLHNAAVVFGILTPLISF